MSCYFSKEGFIMNSFKKVLNHIFIDGLSGMAYGLFATLIVGTILTQIGAFAGGKWGYIFTVCGKFASLLTGAGIGVGVAYKFKASQLVLVSSAVVGMIGAYAGQILAGTVYSGNAFSINAPGEPLGAFIAAYIAVIVGSFISGRTKIDILVTPIVCICIGGAVGLLVGPPISKFMAELGGMVNWGTEQSPFLMGIVVSVLMGMFLTLPISSAAIGIILKLDGLAAGAATVGCCANMIGFAVASFRENKVGGLFSQGLGTSMIQIPNIVRHPLIWIPAITASAVLGPVSTMIFKMQSNPTGSGMGTAGLVGPLMSFETMVAKGTSPTVAFVFNILMYFIFPAIIALTVSEFMRKSNLIKQGDMRLSL